MCKGGGQKDCRTAEERSDVGCSKTKNNVDGG